MGAGVHGGFGATKGSYHNKKITEKTVKNQKSPNYTREQLIDFLVGKTPQSTKIAEDIKNGKIMLSVLGDEFFDRAFTDGKKAIALAKGNKIYLRRSSASIFSDMVHEGTHALDYLSGIPESQISTWKGEIRAYTAEHHFQKAAGLTVEHANEDDIQVFVWSNYKNGGN